MSEAEMRLLCEPDLSCWFALEQRAFSEPWSETRLRQLLGKPRYLNLGLFRDKELVAFAIFSFVLDEAELLQIAVAVPWRGQHVGEQLFDAALNHLGQQGICRILLEVRASNQSAISLYKRMKFSEDGCRKGYYPTVNGREDAILMSLQFKNDECPSV